MLLTVLFFHNYYDVAKMREAWCLVSLPSAFSVRRFDASVFINISAL